jgi:predicted transcriptional regulator
VKKARKRAPGGGRKPHDSTGSYVVVVRLDKDLRKEIKRLAERRGHETSTEIRSAIKYWLKKNEIRYRHTEALASAIGLLTDRIEEITDAKWLNDPLTAQLVREKIERLVAHLIAAPAEPVNVPIEIREAVDRYLTLLTISVSRPGSPGLGRVRVIVDDRGLVQTLDALARDIGGARHEKDLPNVVALDPLVARRDQKMRDRKRRK